MHWQNIKSFEHFFHKKVLRLMQNLEGCSLLVILYSSALLLKFFNSFTYLYMYLRYGWTNHDLTVVMVLTYNSGSISRFLPTILYNGWTNQDLIVVMVLTYNSGSISRYLPTILYNGWTNQDLIVVMVLTYNSGSSGNLQILAHHPVTLC